MKRYLPASSVWTMAAVAAVWLSAAPASAQGDRGPAGMAGERGGSAGGATGGVAGGGGSSGGGGGSSAAAGGGSSSGGSGGEGGRYTGGTETGRARGIDRGAGGQGATGGGGYAVPRGNERGEGRRGGVAGNGGADRTNDGAPSGVPAYARPRDGREPIGTAVPRGTVDGGNLPIVVRGAGYYGGYYGGYYDPWWYGAGYIGDYGGYYDPWYGGYPSSPQGTYSSSSYQEEGKLRLKIKPREAEVYVDGYYAGVVDDFDGVFQRLHLETGAHRIVVRAPGYEPLEIAVRISLDQTTTYEGELKKIP
jgi:PEGA domain-containing protein